VDGLIVDEDVNRAYVYEDRRASAAITAALKAAAAGQGTLDELLADTPALAEAMATATAELETKVCVHVPREELAGRGFGWVRRSVLGRVRTSQGICAEARRCACGEAEEGHGCTCRV